MKPLNWTHTIQLTPRPPTVGRLLQRASDGWLMWLERARQRRKLGELDQRMLRDIGVSPSAAFGETRKWFWQP